MKKYSILALILVLTVSLCACGRRDEQPDMTNPPAATPAPTTVPSQPNMDPTIDTNIPDPEVDSNSTMPGGMTSDPGNESGIGSETDGTGSETDGTGEHAEANDNTRSRMRKIK